MLVYLSLLDASEVAAFEVWANAYLGRLDDAFQSRFAPVMAGFSTVVGGSAFDADDLAPATGGHRFLGWSVGRHWLLEERSAELSRTGSEAF
jgi:hypothetical protein